MTATSVRETIFALSSGRPPAGIAVIRVSGPAAGDALRALARTMPRPRTATLRTLRAGDEILDRGLVLWLPGPATATGEDVAEFHVHGGRAVVSGVEEVLAALPGMRMAEAGEFTRRALEHGRIDLTEAEGIADLLQAETATQRRAALALSSGSLSREIARWQERLLDLSARAEAALDFAEEGDVAGAAGVTLEDLRSLAEEIAAWRDAPTAERLRDGIRVVLAGPPNTGKSSLLNALADREAAIVSAIPGTTRDLIEVPVAINGMPFLFTDTAGLRDTDDPVERIGVDRATDAVAAADLVLWLGDEAPPTVDASTLLIRPRADLPGRGVARRASELCVSVVDLQGLPELRRRLITAAALLIPGDSEKAVNERHRLLLNQVHDALVQSSGDDPVLLAQSLMEARTGLNRITGAVGVEDMLNRLFGALCIGK